MKLGEMPSPSGSTRRSERHERRTPSAIGGTTLSAALADSQAQLSQLMGAGTGTGTDSLAQFAATYRASGGGPTLTLLGFNPFQIIATGAFHDLYWATVVIFLGITACIAMQRSLIGRPTLSGRHPLAITAQVYFRLLAGVLIIANTPLIYGVLMTLNRSLSQGVQAMAQQSMTSLLQTGSMGTLTFAQARIDAIRNASARRAIALYPANATRAEMIQVGTWYNAMAGAINADLSAQNLPGQLAVLNSAVWANAATPDDQVTASVGRTVVQNFSQMVADLAALPSGSDPLAIPFPTGSSTSLALLSASLAADDAQAAQAIALANTPSSNAAFEAARQLYAKNVMTDTLAYLDTQLLAVVGTSPTLAQQAKAWFSEKVEQAAAAAGGFLTEWRIAVDWIGRGIGVVLTRIAAFFFAAGTEVLIEVELFVLVLTVPLWLMPATEDAFYGVLRSLISLSVAVPAYQFIMLLVDALMGLVLKYILFGPLATSSAGSVANGAGAAYVAAAVAVVSGGGEIVSLVTFCYLVSYLFLAVYVALKTPKLVAVFLKGAGAAGMFLSTFATGLISGAAIALSTAAVAGGGGPLVGKWLGGGAGTGSATGPVPLRPAPGPGGGVSSRTPLGPLVASSIQRPPPPAMAPAPVPPAPESAAPTPRNRGGVPSIGKTVGFGLRTFMDCLEADSPADGFHIALRALETHRKQREKEAESLHKAQQQAAKAAAPATSRSKRTAAGCYYLPLIKVHLFHLFLPLGFLSADPTAGIEPSPLSAPTMKAADLAALAAQPPAASAPDSAPLRLIVPNADGVLDLATAGQVESTDRIPNPFRTKHPPPRPFREVTLTVTAVLVGDKAGNATAMVNGRVYAAGDAIEGLTVAAITADAIELRTDRLRLRVPMQEQPVILRLAR